MYSSFQCKKDYKYKRKRINKEKRCHCLVKGKKGIYRRCLNSASPYSNLTFKICNSHSNIKSAIKKNNIYWMLILSKTPLKHLLYPIGNNIIKTLYILN